MEQSNSLSDTGELILIMKVQISDDTQVELLVHENDEPEILAMQFCSKHSLNRDAEIQLAKEIEAQIDILLDELEGQDTGTSTVIDNGENNSIQDLKSHGKILEDPYNRLKNSPGERFTSITPEVFENRINKQFLKCDNESPVSYETTQYSKRVTSNASPKLFPIRRPVPSKSPTKLLKTPQETHRLSSPVCNKSHQIYEKLQEERIQHIFNSIGGSKGILKKESLTFKNLPLNLLEILKPVLEILEVVKHDISYTDFHKLFLQLLRIVSPLEKDILLLPMHRWAKNRFLNQPRDSKYSMSLLCHQSPCMNSVHSASSHKFTFNPKVNKRRSSNIRSEHSMNPASSRW